MILGSRILKIKGWLINVKQFKINKLYTGSDKYDKFKNFFRFKKLRLLSATDPHGHILCRSPLSLAEELRKQI